MSTNGYSACIPSTLAAPPNALSRGIYKRQKRHGITRQKKAGGPKSVKEMRPGNNPHLTHQVDRVLGNYTQYSGAALGKY
jgi:hypothetical protein